MSRRDAKAHYERSTAETGLSAGWISASDAMNAIDNIYDDLDVVSPDTGNVPVILMNQVKDGPVTIPLNGQVLTWDSGRARWDPGNPVQVPLRFRGGFSSIADLTAITDVRGGDFAVIKGSSGTASHLYLYNSMAVPAPAWQDMGPFVPPKTDHNSVFWGTSTPSGTLITKDDLWLSVATSSSTTKIFWGGTAPLGASANNLWLVASSTTVPTTPTAPTTPTWYHEQVSLISNTAHTITHGLGNKWVTTAVYDNGGNSVIVDVKLISNSSLELTSTTGGTFDVVVTA